MSLFSRIANAEHTFATWAEKELAKLSADAPAIEEVAATVLKWAIPAISIIVGAEAGPAAGAIVSDIGAEAQRDLTAVGGLIYDFGATPTAASAVASVQKNLAALLTAGHITNPVSGANVTKVVNSLGALVSALAPAPPVAGS